jgi:hypothetical protein
MSMARSGSGLSSAMTSSSREFSQRSSTWTSKPRQRERPGPVGARAAPRLLNSPELCVQHLELLLGGLDDASLWSLVKGQVALDA